MNMQTPVILTIASLAILLPNQVRADELKEAKVTQVIQDVKVLPSNASPRPASVNDNVRPGTAVQTGVQSRSELTFKDKTITRLGEKTIFSVGEGARTIDLGSGQFLLYVPKKAGGAKVKMGPVTAAITGTTILGDYDPSGVTRIIVLEGGACIYLDSVGQSIFVGPGQGITYDPIYGRLGDPYDIDVNEVTSGPLIKDFRELPSAPYFRSTAQRQAVTAAAVGDEGAVAAAVRATGATSVATATPEQFMQGLGTLFARSTPAEVCAYVGVAVRARPDLATRIVASALTASRASQYSHTDYKDFKDFKQPVGKEIGCDEVICITQAAITAYPSAAREIVEAAQAAVPLLAYCITVPCPLSNAFVQPRVPTTINPNNFRTPPPVSPEQPVTSTDHD